MYLFRTILANIRKNLTAVVFSAVGFFLIAVVWIFIYLKLELDYKLILDGSRSNLQNIARSFKEHTESSLAISDELLRIIKFNYERSDKVDYKTLNDYFQNGVLDMKFFNQVGVIDKEGIYSYSNVIGQKKIDLSDREHFKIHKQSYPYDIYVSRPVLGRVSKRWSIQITRRINTSDGSFNGVAVVSFDPLYFLNFYKKIDLGANGFIALVDLDGFVRTIEAGKLSSIDGSIAQIKLDRQIKEELMGFKSSDQIFDGVKRLYAFERIADQPMLVLVGVQESEALKEYSANKATYLTFGLTLTLLIIAFTVASIYMILKARALNETLKLSNLEAELANQEKLQFANRLTQSEKLAAIGQLSAGVAHEINNPIGYVGSNINTMKKYFEQFETVIKLYRSKFDLLKNRTELTKKDSENNETKHDADKDTLALDLEEIQRLTKSLNLDFIMQDSHELIKETQEGILRVKNIIQDLKNFARADTSSRFEASDLHQAIKSTLNIVSNEVKYSADVLLELGDIPLVECIPSQINQVILNLIVNAAQATKPGSRGLIKIRTYVQSPEGSLEGGTRNLAPAQTPGLEPRFVVIEVQDQGTGISEENISKVFDPFFTTKGVGVGTGLGLSVSHGIIQKHGGVLELTSVINEGTCFKIVLPIKHPPGMDLTQTKS